MRRTCSGANLTVHDSASKMRARYSTFPLALVASWLAMAPSVAQSPPRPPKPYAPVAITRVAPSDDAEFITFRKALAAVAKRRLYTELSPLLLTQGFFWDRDFGRHFDQHSPPVDNLAVATALEQNNGAGWDALATFAAEAAVEPLDSRPGVVCAPARPGYDGVAFTKMLDMTYTSDKDWAYPRADETPVRDAPQPDAAVSSKFGVHFIRLLGFEGPDSDPAPSRNLWARVAMPDGKIGFVAPGSLMSLTSARLCYIKDVVGWRIAGYIARRN
jgi:hypothetical protein